MIRIEEIREDHIKLGAKIAAFEAQQAARTIEIPAQSIVLKDGEEYAGYLVGEDGRPTHHVILLPGDSDDINFEGAQAWAKDGGGDLPDRREQALLYASLKDKFRQAWYWSKTQHVSDGSYVWGQHFSNGSQNYCYEDGKLRARAVRRSPIY